MENNKLHILVVDDDDRIRSLLKDYLNENKFIVSTAENSEEAKKKLDYLKFVSHLSLNKTISIFINYFYIKFLYKFNYLGFWFSIK